MSVRDYGPKEGVRNRSSQRLRGVSPEPERRRQGGLLRGHDRADAGRTIPQSQERREGGAGRAQVRRAAGAAPLCPPESDDLREGSEDGADARRKPPEARLSGVRRALT